MSNAELVTIGIRLLDLSVRSPVTNSGQVGSSACHRQKICYCGGATFASLRSRTALDAFCSERGLMNFVP